MRVGAGHPLNEQGANPKEPGSVIPRPLAALWALEAIEFSQPPTLVLPLATEDDKDFFGMAARVRGVQERDSQRFYDLEAVLRSDVPACALFTCTPAHQVA